MTAPKARLVVVADAIPKAASNRSAEDHLEIQSGSATGVAGVSEFAEFSVGTREVRISLQR